jgi:hypothetical protein
MVLIFTHLGRVSLPVIVVVNTLMFVGIFSRMVPFRAMVSSVPSLPQRGSFNAISSSLQQLSGGIASIIAGHIVVVRADHTLGHFEVVGYVVVGASVVAAGLLWRGRGFGGGDAVQGGPGGDRMPRQ